MLPHENLNLLFLLLSLWDRPSWILWRKKSLYQHNHQQISCFEPSVSGSSSRSWSICAKISRLYLGKKTEDVRIEDRISTTHTLQQQHPSIQTSFHLNSSGRLMLLTVESNTTTPMISSTSCSWGKLRQASACSQATQTRHKFCAEQPMNAKWPSSFFTFN